MLDITLSYHLSSLVISFINLITYPLKKGPYFTGVFFIFSNTALTHAASAFVLESLLFHH